MYWQTIGRQFRENNSIGISLGIINRINRCGCFNKPEERVKPAT